MNTNNYIFIKETKKFQDLAEFDTVILKVSYFSVLKNSLKYLIDLGFSKNFDEAHYKDVKLDLMKNYEKALIINKKEKTINVISYDYIISELSGTPYYWSKEKIAGLGKIVVINHIQF